MPDNHSTRMPRTTTETQSPPRRPARLADPCAMVLFGATGDLANRLVIPALYNLARTQVLPDNFALIGVARAPGTAHSWREQLYETLKSFVGNSTTAFGVDHIDEDAWQRLADRMSYVQGDSPNLSSTTKFVSRLTRPQTSTVPRATPCSILRWRTSSSATWWSSSARQS